MSFFRHHFAHFIDIIVNIKRNKVFFFHKIFNWHTLIDQTCCRKGIVWRDNHDTISPVCHLKYLCGYLCATGHNHTACIFL